MARYVALLRGINVGGNNLIKMDALRACFERHGFSEVSTFIASGNVLFTAPGAAKPLTERIESILTATFDYAASIVLRSAAQIRQIVAAAPPGFGRQPAKYRYDVVFLKQPLTASAAIELVPSRDGVDQIHAGKGVLYVSRLVSRITQSQLGRVIGLPIYKRMTIRNWNTTTRLDRLLTAP